MNTLQAGSFLQGNKYKIVRFINAGGFGCTYEGLHIMLKKRVAIKEFFVKDFCNRDETTMAVTVGITAKTALVSKLKEKFEDEAQFVGSLKNDHIVNVYDVFEENNTAYYVMDYIDGPSLNDVVKRDGALSEEKALKYMLQIVDALKHVHSHNRLHLDIKPGNIMVDEQDNAILIDFGTSKQYDEVDGENTSALVGKTAGFAPPEQMGNDVVKFSPCTDIYAIGATFYKLLTGITPPSALLLASGDKLKPLPSSISENVSLAIYKSMQNNKEKRPQSIDEFLEILNAPISEDDTYYDGEEDITEVEVDNKNKEGNKNTNITQFARKYKKQAIIALCAVIGLAVVTGIGYNLTHNNNTVVEQEQTVPIENKVTEAPSDIEQVKDALKQPIENVVGKIFKDKMGRDFSYTGEIQNGLPNGKGTGIYPYGTYLGEYKDGLKQGNGQFKYKDGSHQYTGTFHDDQYDTGKLTESDGFYFDGKFKDGQPYNGNWYDENGNLDSKVVNGK